METTYRVIKLNSGEEIIAKIKGEVEGSMLIERPMIFKSSAAFDGFGNQKEVTYLRNWLSFSNQIETEISKVNILTILEPDSDVITLYNKEKEREDTKPNGTTLGPMKPNPMNKKNLEDFMDELEDLVDPNVNHNIDPDMEPEEYLKKMGFDPDQLSNIMDQFFGSDEEGINEKELVNLNISFDAKILKTLVDNDIIPPEYLLRLIDKFENGKSITDEFTGDEKDREDFGNKWTDWNQNPDSDDYQ
tara:strand:- start:6732 stop:7469 length:738 start_codon:yes stop_codon:yes gene_type:complete